MSARARPRTAAQQGAAEVREYIGELPADGRRALKALRALIRTAAPRAHEVISYRIPAFRTGQGMLVWYAAWEEHVSLYPITAAMKRAGGAQLAKFQFSKGTVRFPLTAALPAALVKRMVKARMAELDRKGKGSRG